MSNNLMTELEQKVSSAVDTIRNLQEENAALKNERDSQNKQLRSLLDQIDALTSVQSTETATGVEAAETTAVDTNSSSITYAQNNADSTMSSSISSYAAFEQPRSYESNGT